MPGPYFGRLLGGEGLGRGAFAARQRAVHVAIPHGSGFGAGPVDAADRLAQRGTELGPHARCEVRAVTASRPLFRRPVLFYDVDRFAGALAELAGARREHGAPASVSVDAAEASRVRAFEEADEHAGRA